MNIIDHYEKWTVIWGRSENLYNLRPLKHSPWYLVCGIEKIPNQKKKSPRSNLPARGWQFSFMVTCFVKVKEMGVAGSQRLWCGLAQGHRGEITHHVVDQLEVKQQRPQRGVMKFIQWADHWVHWPCLFIFCISDGLLSGGMLLWRDHPSQARLTPGDSTVFAGV